MSATLRAAFNWAGVVAAGTCRGWCCTGTRHALEAVTRVCICKCELTRHCCVQSSRPRGLLAGWLAGFGGLHASIMKILCKPSHCLATGQCGVSNAVSGGCMACKCVLLIIEWPAGNGGLLSLTCRLQTVLPAQVCMKSCVTQHLQVAVKKLDVALEACCKHIVALLIYTQCVRPQD